MNDSKSHSITHDSGELYSMAYSLKTDIKHSPTERKTPAVAFSLPALYQRRECWVSPWELMF